jgi:hypothetical protein
MERTCRGFRFTRDGVPFYRCADPSEPPWAGVVRDGDGCPACGGIVKAEDALTVTVEAIKFERVPPDGWEVDRGVDHYAATAYAVGKRFGARRFIDCELNDLAMRQRARRDAISEILRAVVVETLKPVGRAEIEVEKR